MKILENTKLAVLKKVEKKKPTSFPGCGSAPKHVYFPDPNVLTLNLVVIRPVFFA